MATVTTTLIAGYKVHTFHGWYHSWHDSSALHCSAWPSRAFAVCKLGAVNLGWPRVAKWGWRGSRQVSNVYNLTPLLSRSKEDTKEFRSLLLYSGRVSRTAPRFFVDALGVIRVIRHPLFQALEVYKGNKAVCVVWWHTPFSGSFRGYKGNKWSFL